MAALLLTVAVSTGATPIEALKDVHPRLLLDAARLQALRARLETTHRFLWERYRADLPHMIAVSKRHAPLDDARYDGDLVPELAFAWLMTGDPELLEVARAKLLRLTSGEAWDANEDLVYLVPGHYLFGVALGYDWLYTVLTRDERSRVMGRSRSRGAVYDYGTGHQHPDAGSFQLFSHGQFLAIDPLYTGYKLSADHNTMLFKGRGQLGEQAGFGSVEALHFGHFPEIVHVRSERDHDLVVGDVTRAYHPALGLKRFVRHLLFVKPDILLVADQVTLDGRGVVHDYPPATLRTAGRMTHAPNDYVVGPEGEAFLEFDGEPGSYRISAVYLDNVPEAGVYSFEVDAQTVHRWKSHNQDIDDHLIAVSPPVALRRGSRVAFHGAPMAAGARLVKMSVFSETVEAPRRAEWLLHLDPKAVLRRIGERLEATLSGASLDIHRLAPRDGRLDFGLHDVAKPEVEPFTFRQTQRIRYEPPFEGQDLMLLTLLHARASSSPALDELIATLEGDQAAVSWSRYGTRASLEWGLDRLTVKLR